jgi:hypothetical protein
MPSSKVSALTKNDITVTARSFRWNRQLPKWSVIVEGRELPARPLILEAAGVPPNDPTNSHQAVAILKQQGFEIRYQGKAVQDNIANEKAEHQEFERALQRLRGSFAGSSLLADREREHKIEKAGSNR